MSTRSRIGIEDHNGRVRSIYCHWDGYPEGVGKTLLEHYADPSKIEELIKLGSISVLDAEIGEKQDFDARNRDANWTLAYHRDRGEPLEVKRSNSAETYHRLATKGWEEYTYLFRQGVWFVAEVGGGAGPFLVTAKDPQGKAPIKWQNLTGLLQFVAPTGRSYAFGDSF